MGYLEHLKRPIIIKTNIIICGHAIWSIPILPLLSATNGIFLFAYQSPSPVSNFRSINDFDWPAQFTHFCHHIAICIMSRILEHKLIPKVYVYIGFAHFRHIRECRCAEPGG